MLTAMRILSTIITFSDVVLLRFRDLRFAINLTSLSSVYVFVTIF